MLAAMDGKHVCISYATARKSNIEWALAKAQSIMWDNGAFSAYTQGVAFDSAGFHDWVAPRLEHPHWAVVPDVIGGTVEQQRVLLKQWPFDKSVSAVVWHLDKPLDYLLELADEWPKVCLGSAGAYWKIATTEWDARMDAVYEYLAVRRQKLPWIHGLRMLAQVGRRWPLASADSANVARNYSNRAQCPGCMGHRIDQVNGPLHWSNLSVLF